MCSEYWKSKNNSVEVEYKTNTLTFTGQNNIEQYQNDARNVVIHTCIVFNSLNKQLK